MSASALLNICGLVPVIDSEFRYRMPPLQSHVVGHGIGKRTTITNLTDVALALHRSPAELIKFFGIATSASSRLHEGGAGVINGVHSTADLQRRLSFYEEHFVLCVNCRYAEVHEYKVRSKSGDIIRCCAACGHRELVDMGHKLCKFILSEHKKVKKAPKLSKAERRAAKEAKRAAKATALPPPPPAAAAAAPEEDEEEEEEEEEQLLEGEEIEDPLCTENVALVRSAAPADLLPLLRSLAVSARDRIGLYVRAVFDEVPANVPGHAAVLNAIVEGNDFMQRHLIGAIERHCGVDHPAILPSFPIVLKHLYDADVLEEEIVLAWSADESGEFRVVDAEVADRLREAADPFVVWLQQAEESEED